MAKKFFYNRVYNTKRTIINIVIISICVIGVILCFIITSNFQAKDNNPTQGTLSIKEEVTIEVNEKFTNEIFFSKIENFDVNNIKVEYPENYDPSTPGTYEVNLEINDKINTVKLKVIDTIKPELKLKTITINEGESYKANDFVSECTDNSQKDCKIEFYKNGVDEDNNKVDYSSYKKAGTYTVKIVAKDESDNEIVEETNLTINGKNQPKPPTPTECKYGNNEYNKDNFLIAIDVTNNNCAVSLDLYKDNSMTEEINKLMNTETTRIKKDVENLNLSGTLALNRKVTAVVNTSGDGIVGYELYMLVNITKNDKTDTVVEYKVDKNGKRVFISNPYNLAK